jgi:hypothetical protein
MKIISKLNLKIDVDSVRHYYSEVEKNFQDLMWTVPVGPTSIKGWSIHGIKSWPKSSLYPFMEEGNEPVGLENYFETDLVFGWAKEILELFPYGYRAAIGESPAGTVIPPHIDPTGSFMLRLQIPVYTNKDCIWTTADGDQHLEVGSAYVVDTSKVHSTKNFGKTPRVHFAMCLPKTHLDDIKKFF